MSIEEAEVSNSYRCRKDIAEWSFRVKPKPDHNGNIPDLANPQHRKIWLASSVKIILKLFGDFCKPISIEVKTLSGFRHIVNTPQYESELEGLSQFMNGHEDVNRVFIPINLKCFIFNKMGELTTLDVYNSYFWIMIDLKCDGLLDTQKDNTPIYFYLNIGTDIYSPYGLQRDNRHLSALNGPLLTGFLQRLDAHFDLDLLEISASGYETMVYRHGFVMPKTNGQN